MDISNTVVLKQVDEFIKLFNDTIETEQLILHAFLLSEIPSELSIHINFKEDRFITFRNECAKVIDPIYSECENEVRIVFNEVFYVFHCVKNKIDLK